MSDVLRNIDIIIIDYGPMTTALNMCFEYPQNDARLLSWLHKNNNNINDTHTDGDKVSGYEMYSNYKIIDIKLANKLDKRSRQVINAAVNISINIWLIVWHCLLPQYSKEILM